MKTKRQIEDHLKNVSTEFYNSNNTNNELRAIRSTLIWVLDENKK